MKLSQKVYLKYFVEWKLDLCNAGVFYMFEPHHSCLESFQSLVMRINIDITSLILI